MMLQVLGLEQRLSKTKGAFDYPYSGIRIDEIKTFGSVFQPCTSISCSVLTRRNTRKPELQQEYPTTQCKDLYGTLFLVQKTSGNNKVYMRHASDSLFLDCTYPVNRVNTSLQITFKSRQKTRCIKLITSATCCITKHNKDKRRKHRSENNNNRV